MTRDDIIRMAQEAGFEGMTGHPVLERFAALVREHLLSTEIHSCHANCQRFACVQTRKAVEAEREKVAAWMIARSFATGHGDTTEDLLKELEWQVRESERKACEKVCDDLWQEDGAAYDCREAIRARSNI